MLEADTPVRPGCHLEWLGTRQHFLQKTRAHGQVARTPPRELGALVWR